jgi:hypothetical protein
MLVIRRTHNSVYCLAELDGAVLRLHYTAFHLIPYHTRSCTSIPVTHVLDKDNLTAVVEEEAEEAPNNDEDALTEDGQDFDPLGGVRSVHMLTLEWNKTSDWSLRAEQIKHWSAQDLQPISTYNNPCIKCSAHAAYAPTRQSGLLKAR